MAMVKYEMEWTVRSFKYSHKLWLSRATSLAPGPDAYARRKASQYLRQARVAETEFRRYHSQMPRVVT